MRRTDPDPSIRDVARRAAAARRDALAGTTAPAGSASLPEGADIAWGRTVPDPATAADPAGTGETRAHWERTGSARATEQRVEKVESAVAALEKGVSTPGRWNTVSTSDAPASADGYPEGAWWTRVASESDLAPTALWTVAGGEWETRPLPAGQTVAPVMNTGLIDAGTVAAAIIRSDEFWTALTGARVGFNKGGFQAYDADGARTILLSGDRNELTGELRAGRSQITSWTSAGGRRAGILFGAPADDMTDAKAELRPRVIGSEFDDSSGADLIISSGNADDRQGEFLLSRQQRRAALIYQEGTAKAQLTLRTDTASYLGGYSTQEGNASGVQFGNGWVDLIGKVGTGLIGSTFRAGTVDFHGLNSGQINRTEVTLETAAQLDGAYRWFVVATPFDWADASRLVCKVTADSRTGFTVCTECTSGGSTQSGFMWLAVRWTAW